MMRKIHVFLRMSAASPNSYSSRPTWFSKEKAFQNLMRTVDSETRVVAIIDSVSMPKFPWSAENVEVVSRASGSDAQSFVYMVEVACSQADRIAKDDIVYFLEDDYLHVPGWPDIMREAFDANIGDYVTLYDHGDKYQEMYSGLASLLYVTQSCHWRSTPSTTSTYAMRFATLLQYKNDHVAFCDVKTGNNRDHSRFLFLGNLYRARLVSSIPGFCTHAEKAFLSPVRSWENYL